MAGKIVGRVWAGLAVLGASALLSGCAGATVDWASVGGGLVNKACKNSSHCDLPCPGERAGDRIPAGGIASQAPCRDVRPLRP